MASNIVTDVSQLNGMFKDVYADKVRNLIPDVAVLQKMISFTDSTKIGDAYNQPVKLTASQGITYAGPNAGAFALNAPVALTTKNAIVQGNQMLLRDRMSYDAAAKSSHGGTKSFVEGTRYLVDSMMETMAKRLEISMFYGESGLGNAATSANVTGTQTAVTFSDAEWAVGIWSGLENTNMEFYDAGVLVSTGADSLFTVLSMDVDTRTVTFEGTATGITALDAAILGNAGGVNAYFQGSKGNEMAGLDQIITNTGVLFNIDAAQYNLWKGNTFAAGGVALTFDIILKAVARAVGRGLNESVTCFVNPNTWKDLATDLAAFRQLDSSYSTSMNENGQEAISFYGQNGKINIVSHSVIKGGEAFILPVGQLKRIGASDVRFKPYGGSSQERFFLELQDNAGYELRSYCDQAIFLQTPARSIKIDGIVNV